MKRYFEKESHAVLYRLYRPKTTNDIASDIVRYVEEKRPSPLQLAVDVGCGSGQNTFAFAEYFDSIIGTDVSSAQVAEAQRELVTNSNETTLVSKLNVAFAVASAEDMSGIVLDHSVDLVMGSMCFHWFDLPKFYAEVRRVLAPNGVVAALGHVTWELCHPTDFERSKSLSKLSQALERALEYHPLLDELVQFYKDLQPFPFEDKVTVEVEPKIIQQTLSHYLGSVKSWSPFERFKSNNPEEAVVLFEKFKKDILSGYGYDESVNPDEAIVHTRWEYYYVMGRVQ